MPSEPKWKAGFAVGADRSVWLMRVMLEESLDINKDIQRCCHGSSMHICAHLSPTVTVHLIIIPHVYDSAGRNVIREHPEHPCDIMRAIQVLVGPSELHL